MRREFSSRTYLKENSLSVLVPRSMIFLHTCVQKRGVAEAPPAPSSPPNGPRPRPDPSRTPAGVGRCGRPGAARRPRTGRAAARPRGGAERRPRRGRRPRAERRRRRSGRESPTGLGSSRAHASARLRNRSPAPIPPRGSRPGSRRRRRPRRRPELDVVRRRGPCCRCPSSPRAPPMPLARRCSPSPRQKPASCQALPLLLPQLRIWRAERYERAPRPAPRLCRIHRL
jgi:hypothetical protein